MPIIGFMLLRPASLRDGRQIARHVLRLVRFCTVAGVLLAFGVGVMLMSDNHGEASSGKNTENQKPYGIDRRIPWTTSHVVGFPDADSIVPETQVNLSSIERKPEAFVEAGKAIFNGKGTCYSCHTLNPSAPKSRGPDLTDIGARAATRKPRFAGFSAKPKPDMGSKAYLIESLYAPDAFLVPGYGKTMMPAWKPPISLSNLEIEAVIAFLQSQGGEVDLTPFEPFIDIQSVAKEMEARPPVLAGDIERGKNVFVNTAKCIACHNVDGIEKPVNQRLDEGVEIVLGPDLTDIATLNSVRYIEESILKPNAGIVRGYGLATVRTGGAVIQGTLVSQVAPDEASRIQSNLNPDLIGDNEKIVLRIKGANGAETERAILLSELDPEPIEALVNLKEKGYFWIQVMPADSTTPISGDLIEATDKNITLKVGDGVQTVSKSNVKVQAIVTPYNDEPIVGELISENKAEITLKIDGSERTFDKYEDLAGDPEYSRALGKRLNVTSPMPTNYSQILSVAEYYDLLAFLSTLTGKTAETGPPLSLHPKQTFTKLKLDQPVYIEREPGTDQLLVIELGGKIRRFTDDPEVDEAELLFDTGRETYGLTFHPDYEKNGDLYVVSNGPKGGKVTETKNRISRCSVERQPPYHCDKHSEPIIMEWQSNNHNGGDLAFGPDGFLYIAAGDGAMDSDTNLTGQPGSYDREPKGQDISNVLATIMRIDVDHPEAGRAYSVPADNPFIGFEGARPEIWAYGIRNPWRMTFDQETGHLWVGNVGQDQWEMIHLVRRGDNYGWSLYEGSHPFFLNRKPGPTPIVKPTVEHPHSESRSITGGVVYYGSKFPELRGAYIYGDYATGKIWALRHNGERIIWHREIADTTLQIVSFGIDHNDEILIADLASGIFQLEHKPKDELTAKFPTRLSGTGLFASVKDHQTVPGLIPYSVNAPLWADGAHMERFIGLPGDSQIDFTTSHGWTFPDGTVLVQTFALDLEAGNPAPIASRRSVEDSEQSRFKATSRHRIETRLLTRQQNEWVGYSYVWNDEQTDATLVAADGMDRILTIQDSKSPEGSREQIWRYPSRVECMVCHSRAANYVLGLNTMQMNKTHDYGGVSDNQLRTLDHLGIFTKPLPKRPEEYPKLVNPYNPQESLDARARSYLHAACANCHVHTGGGNAHIVLEFTAERDKTYTFGVRPQHDTFGISNAMLIAPGSPDRSIIYHRVLRRGAGQMPPLATSVVDHQAIQLLRDWISQMEPTTEKLAR